MSTPNPLLGAGRGGFPTLPKGETVATYDTYPEALAAVDRLVDADFPVRAVSIVGNDLKSVERVTGRLSWGRAAASGAATGAWFGLFFGLLTVAFGVAINPGFLLGMLLIVAAAGMLLRIATYAITRRRKDFSSIMQVLASSYSLVVEQSDSHRARGVLANDAAPVAQETAVPVVQPAGAPVDPSA